MTDIHRPDPGNPAWISAPPRPDRDWFCRCRGVPYTDPDDAEACARLDQRYGIGHGPQSAPRAA